MHGLGSLEIRTGPVLVNQLFPLTQITFCLIFITGVESGEGLAPPQEKN